MRNMKKMDWKLKKGKQNKKLLVFLDYSLARKILYCVSCQNFKIELNYQNLFYKILVNNLGLLKTKQNKTKAILNPVWPLLSNLTNEKSLGRQKYEHKSNSVQIKYIKKIGQIFEK